MASGSFDKKNKVKKVDTVTTRRPMVGPLSGTPGAGPARPQRMSKHYYGHVPTGRPK